MTSSTIPSRFWSWLRSIAPYSKPLAWCHNTDAFALRRIIEEGQLAPCACPVFGESLLYFFYGRPAYRFNEQGSMRISGRAPVVIVLDPDIIAEGKRLHPFDTGAFENKRYTEWLHESMQLADFELACPSDAPQRHVSSFFGTNMDYLLLKARKPTQPYPGEYEVDSLVALLTDPSTERADDRRIAVELQTDKPIPFRSPQIKALILPDELRQAPWMSAFETGAGADVELVTYDLTPLKKAGEYQGLLERETVQIQKKWGLT